MNRIRKRFSRWGGGRLARALAPARVRVFVVSDVIGDDLAVDRLRALRPRSVPPPREVRAGCSRSAALWDRIPGGGPRLVAGGGRRGETPETPKPGDEAFARVTLELIASNRLALEAAARRAAELGLAPVVADDAARRGGGGGRERV